MAKTIPVSGFVLWRGIGDVVYVRLGRRGHVGCRVKRRDGRNDARVAQRKRFGEAVAAWKHLSRTDKEEYRLRAEFLRRSGFQLFLSEWL